MYTEHSYKTDEELLTEVGGMPKATPMEIELAARLQHALDELGAVSDSALMLADALYPARG